MIQSCWELEGQRAPPARATQLHRQAGSEWPTFRGRCYQAAWGSVAGVAARGLWSRRCGLGWVW